MGGVTKRGIRKARALVLAGLLLAPVMDVGCASGDVRRHAVEGQAGAGEAGCGGSSSADVGGAGPNPAAGGEAGRGGTSDENVIVWGVSSAGQIWYRDADGWHYHSTQTQGLHAIWGTGPDDIWAGGDSNQLLHYDGTAWADAYGSSWPSSAIRAIHGSGRDDVWAVGDAGFALHYDGSEWTAVRVEAETPINEPFSAVWAGSPEEAWLGGPTGKVFEWDGSALTEHTISTAPIRIQQFWSGDKGPIWALADLNTSCTVWGDDEELWANDRSFVLQKGKNGWVERYASREYPRIYSLFGLADDAVWLMGVGYDAESCYYFWNGTDFNFDAGSGRLGSPRRIWGTDPQHLWVLFADGVYRLGPGGFTQETDVKLDAIWGPGEVRGCADDCPSESVPEGSELEELGCPRDGCSAGVCDLDAVDTCFCPNGYHEVEGGCAASFGCTGNPCGEHGTCHPGAAFYEDTCECTHGYVAHQEPLGCGINAEPPANSGWVVEDAGLVRGEWNGLWASGPDDVWVVGGMGHVGKSLVAHLGEDGWTTRSLPSDGSRQDSRAIDVTGTGPTNVWLLVGEGYRYMSQDPEYSLHHFDGTSWLRLPFDPGSDLMGSPRPELLRAYTGGSGVCVSGRYVSDFVDASLLFWYRAPLWWMSTGTEVWWWNRMCGDSTVSANTAYLCGEDEANDELWWRSDAPQSPHVDDRLRALDAWDVGFDPMDVELVGPTRAYAIDPDHVAYFDGTSWAEVPAAPRPPLKQLAATDGEMWALEAGAPRATLVGYHDGVSWTWLDLEGCDHSPTAISVSPSGIVHTTCRSSSGQSLFVRLRSGGTVDSPDPDATGLDESDGIWQGDGAWVRQWTGTQWVTYDLGEDANVGRVAAAANQNVWGIDRQVPVIHSFDGNGWTKKQFDGKLFVGIRAIAEDDVWALAADKLVHWDGSDWQQYAPANGMDDFCIDEQGRPWVLSHNTVRVLENGEWTASYVPAIARPTHMACTTDRIWVGGSGAPFAWRVAD